MPDFDDIPFDRTPTPQPPPRMPSGPPLWPIAAGAALVVALGALLYFGKRSEPPPPAQRTVPKATVDVPRGRGEPGEAIDLPPLDQSDGVVRTLVARLSSHPAVAAWLTTNGLIRNATVVVHNIADGNTPAKHLGPLRPAGRFATTTSRGATWIDPASYRRYDGMADAVDGLDARGVARLYATVKPRIDDAYKDLIGADANFDRTLERAIVMLLRTPVVDNDIQVRTDKVTYAFASPALEDLTKAQRQFLRMGPRNMRIVKAKLRAIAGFLGIPEAALPPPDSNSSGRD
jgi:Protein of unknown function (DUF3014)